MTQTFVKLSYYTRSINVPGTEVRTVQLRLMFITHRNVLCVLLKLALTYCCWYSVKLEKTSLMTLKKTSQLISLEIISYSQNNPDDREEADAF